MMATFILYRMCKSFINLFTHLLIYCFTGKMSTAVIQFLHLAGFNNEFKFYAKISTYLCTLY